jgi:GalNAc-alpha-(1->4)-GalNAc-alpha-(1->3)-diNAcBac-PP-undecaprenol alpha-1,4-N-acetyl-D-galactosaminyltransferase
MSANRPLKLTLVISSLSSGGAERIMSVMANYWAAKGWNITLITLDSVLNDFYELDSRVKRVGLAVMGESQNDFKAIINNIYRISRLRHAIRKSTPDVVVSFVDRMNVLTLLSAFGLGLKIIISERSDPTQHKIGSIWNIFRCITYPWADAIVVQNEYIRRWGNRFRKSLVVVIPNPVVSDSEKQEDEMGLFDLIKLDNNDDNLKIIASVGRLSNEKGFELLLKAFKKVANSNPEWRLVIFGEGEERNKLKRIARDFGIGDKVFLPGRVKNPAFLLKQADLFVMPSRYEGFPNALCEAMVCGLPVISFDCPSGPRDIIRDGVDGILVPPEDANALAEAIAKLIDDVEKRRMLSQNAKQVTERFGLSQVIRKWEELIYHEQ